MGLLREATNQSAFLKVGILGFQGSGKTYTAVEIALGLHEHIGATKPVAFVDTETGSDWAIPRFQAKGISLTVAKTRAFRDLLAIIPEAAKDCEILIIDSVSHFWAELLEAYKRQHRLSGRIPFHHWQPIKDEWRKFSELFVNSELHLIVAGRAAWEYDYLEEEDGSKELVKTGTKMRAEGEFGYEPSLVLEMERVRATEDGKNRNIGAKITHRCHVLKDRQMNGESLDGQVFDNPTFEDFLPHVKALNLGGQHLGVESERHSDEMFEPNGESYSSTQRRRQIFLENIAGELEAAYPGSGKQERWTKAALKKHLLGTYSDTEIALKAPEELETALYELRELIEDGDAVERILSEAMAQGKNGKPDEAEKPKPKKSGKGKNAKVEADLSKDPDHVPDDLTV